MTLIKYHGGEITRGTDTLRASDIVRTSDVITVSLPEDKNDITPVSGELNILYEDDYLLIVNKPYDMPVHPTKIHQLDTLANIVSYHQQSRGESYTFRALNRLDKDTSGCVAIAKDRLSYSIVLPTISKEYVAVCEGIIEHSGVVDSPIALAADSKIHRCVDENGQHAVTHYEPIASGNDHTLLRLRLETGRTHQIRCHMSSIGHPLAGDDLYGGRRDHIGRQALHCEKMTLLHPVTHEKLSFDTGIPDEFMRIIKN